MKKKVLLISTDYRWFGETYSKAFTDLGWDCTLIKTHIGLKEFDLPRRVMVSFGYSAKRYIDKNREIASQHILEMYNSINPDLVYVIGGNDVTADAIKQMKRKSKTILHMGDTLRAMPYVIQTAPQYDVVYTYEKSELLEHKKIGVCAYWTKGTYDPTCYFPLVCNKVIDVCFVGTMLPDRKEILEKLVADMPDLKFAFYGEYVKINKPKDYLTWLFGSDKKSFKNKNLRYDKVNELYNKSKICLNINNKQAKTCWSSRLPEILGTCSFELVDDLPCIRENFNGCLDTFRNIDEMERKIRYYLEHFDVAHEIAKKGYDVVKEQYTVVVELQRILEQVNCMTSSEENSND